MQANSQHAVHHPHHTAHTPMCRRYMTGLIVVDCFSMVSLSALFGQGRCWWRVGVPVWVWFAPITTVAYLMMFADWEWNERFVCGG